MPLEDHWRRLHADPAERSRRERHGFAALVATLFTIVVSVMLGVAVTVSNSGGLQRGCLDATVASTTGGARLHVCGANARRLCAGDPAASVPPDAALRSRCRSLGLATRSS